MNWIAFGLVLSVTTAFADTTRTWTYTNWQGKETLVQVEGEPGSMQDPHAPKNNFLWNGADAYYRATLYRNPETSPDRYTAIIFEHGPGGVPHVSSITMYVRDEFKYHMREYAEGNGSPIPIRNGNSKGYCDPPADAFLIFTDGSNTHTFAYCLFPR